MLNFEHFDSDSDVERSRQLAESVPLHPSDYVNPIVAVAEKWLAREAAKLQPSHPETKDYSRKGSLHLSTYDIDSESTSTHLESYLVGGSAPIPPSSGNLIVPHAVVNFLQQAVPNSVIRSNENKDHKAWQLLCDYQLGSVTGDYVKVALDELQVGVAACSHNAGGTR